MARMLPEQAHALKILADHSEVAAHICGAVAEDQLGGILNVHTLCTQSRLARGRAGDVERFLEAAEPLRLTQKVSGLYWKIADRALMASLAPMFEAINLYRIEVHQDDNSVEVVLTKPPHPSSLAKRLESTLRGTWGLHETRGVLPAIAEKARKRFVVMTPFLDEYGGELIVDLYQNVGAGVNKQLVLRAKPDGKLPDGYVAQVARLKDLGVQVFNFRLPKMAGNETFHAKMALADNQCAYVGSANMTEYSFEYSLELGLMVTGHAAARIGDIIDAITSISEILA